MGPHVDLCLTVTHRVVILYSFAGTPLAANILGAMPQVY